MITPSIIDMVYARKKGKWREGYFPLREGYGFIEWDPILLKASGCQRPKAYLAFDAEIVGTNKLLDLLSQYEIKTTFASHYTKEISLAEVLMPENINVYSKQATNEKYLINPNK